MTQKKMTRKQWCKEFAPDMGYRFVDKDPKYGLRKYALIGHGRALVFTNLLDVQNHILRDLQRHIGKHTVIVPARRKR